jgi:hypothetical protein
MMITTSFIFKDVFKHHIIFLRVLSIVRNYIRHVNVSSWVIVSLGDLKVNHWCVNIVNSWRVLFLSIIQYDVIWSTQLWNRMSFWVISPSFLWTWGVFSFSSWSFWILFYTISYFFHAFFTIMTFFFPMLKFIWLVHYTWICALNLWLIDAHNRMHFIIILWDCWHYLKWF